MKTLILILFNIGLSNFLLGQIRSERQVRYWLDKNADEKDFYNNNSKDSCVIFWEEYNRNGKVTKEYDFPSDRCWKINGPWEHHYFYDTKGRIIEHRFLGGKEGKERTLMSDSFYSYPFIDEPHKANNVSIIYDYRANTKIEEEKIDTFYFDTINTKGMFYFLRTGWKYDTMRFDEGSFIFKKNFERDKSLFSPDLLLPLLKKDSIEDFEISLLEKRSQIINKLNKIYDAGKSYFCEFEFIEESNGTSLEFKVSEYFISIKYKFLNRIGDCYLSFSYQIYKGNNKLDKTSMVKYYIEYY